MITISNYFNVAKAGKRKFPSVLSTANAWIVPVCFIYISIMVVIIFMKEPTLWWFLQLLFYTLLLYTQAFFASDDLLGLVSSKSTLNGYPCSPAVFWWNSASLQLVQLFWIILSSTHSEITELLIRCFCLPTTYRATLLDKILPWPLQAPELQSSGSSPKSGIMWGPTKIHMVPSFLLVRQ